MNSDSLRKYAICIAQYAVYIMSVKAGHQIISLFSKWTHRDGRYGVTTWQRLLNSSRTYVYLMVSLLGFLLYMGETLLGHEFLLFTLASLVTKYPEQRGTVSINYGVGMACSYFEGYLAYIIPSDGGQFVGFEENIRAYEMSQRVTFPVKKMFIVVTKSLYCPPDLKEFNKPNTNIPYLEACQSLGDVEKDVAGVKNRIYRNSAYQIRRPAAPPVYLAVECATPVHTLFKVLEKQAVYEELSNIDAAEIVDDFCAMLRNVISRTPNCKGKCEIVYYDDTNPKINLAELLLDRIRQIEPEFESIRHQF